MVPRSLRTGGWADFFRGKIELKHSVFDVFHLKSGSNPSVFAIFHFSFIKGALCKTLVFLLFFTLDGEVLEPILPHFGASFWGPPKVGSKTSPQELPGERSWNLGAPLGTPWDPLGSPWEPPWAPLRPPWEPLGLTWAPLGSLWGAAGCLLGAFGTFCDHLGSLWQPISCLF